MSELCPESDMRNRERRSLICEAHAYIRRNGQEKRLLESVDIVESWPIASWANAMLGEVSPKIAMAISSSPAIKILVPLSQERVEIMGCQVNPCHTWYSRRCVA